jgi:hypothetical protein
MSKTDQDRAFCPRTRTAAASGDIRAFMIYAGAWRALLTGLLFTIGACGGDVRLVSDDEDTRYIVLE